MFQTAFAAARIVLTQRGGSCWSSIASLSPWGRERPDDGGGAAGLSAGIRSPEQEPRVILYRPYAAEQAPVFGEDFNDHASHDGAHSASLHLCPGDSMVPIPDGSVVYVNRDPLKAGDVGIFAWTGISSASSIKAIPPDGVSFPKPGAGRCGRYSPPAAAGRSPRFGR